MAGKRKDNKGRNLRTGEYYDSKNKRYMFRKMVDGERISITATDLAELRAQILGHASTSVTLDTYTHLTEDKQKEQENVAKTVKIS